MKTTPLPFTNSVHDVMNVKQAADYLQMSADWVYEAAADGRIPARRVGGHWRFFREELDRWMEAQSWTSATQAPSAKRQEMRA